MRIQDEDNSVKEFEIALEELYFTFSKYQSKHIVEGCSCCVSDSDKSRLHANQLRELNNENLSRYSFKAITTWGTINDFKYYLPRIFELSARRELVVDTFVILGKLEYGEWTEWDIKEQNSIKKFLIAWWKYDINNSSYFDCQILIQLNKVINNLPKMLSLWKLNFDSIGYRNFIDFIESYYYDLNTNNTMFRRLDLNEIEILIQWVKSNLALIEEGFFHYRSIDKEFSNRISDILYMVERMK